MVFVKTRKTRSDAIWTYKQFLDNCNSPKEIVAVLYPNDRKGFKLFAKDMEKPEEEHPVWEGSKLVCFRTIEQAMTVLSDVPHLNQRIELEISKWQQAVEFCY